MKVCIAVTVMWVGVQVYLDICHRRHHHNTPWNVYRLHKTALLIDIKTMDHKIQRISYLLNTNKSTSDKTPCLELSDFTPFGEGGGPNVCFVWAVSGTYLQHSSHCQMAWRCNLERCPQKLIKCLNLHLDNKITPTPKQISGFLNFKGNYF